MEEYFDLKSRGVFATAAAAAAAAAPDESSRRIKEEEEEEESGQTADREDADRQTETQSTDSGGDEQNERMQAMVNLFQSLLESLTDGEQGESDPSNDAGSFSQSPSGRSAKLCCDGSCSPINRSMYIYIYTYEYGVGQHSLFGRLSFVFCALVAGLSCTDRKAKTKVEMCRDRSRVIKPT